MLAVLAFAVVLGVGLPLRELPAQAQTAGAASTSAAQPPDKNQQEVDEHDAYRKSPSVGWLGKKLGIGTDRAATLSELGNFVLFALGVAWLVVVFLPKASRGWFLAIARRRFRRAWRMRGPRPKRRARG